MATAGSGSSTNGAKAGIEAGARLRPARDLPPEPWFSEPTLSRPTRARMIETAQDKQALATAHRLHLGDARALDWVEAESIHLVVTSPPYWTLKKYNDTPGQ
jgi:hypothetical protein